MQASENEPQPKFSTYFPCCLFYQPTFRQLMFFAPQRFTWRPVYLYQKDTRVFPGNFHSDKLNFTPVINTGSFSAPPTSCSPSVVLIRNSKYWRILLFVSCLVHVPLLQVYPVQKGLKPSLRNLGTGIVGNWILFLAARGIIRQHCRECIKRPITLGLIFRSLILISQY